MTWSEDRNQIQARVLLDSRSPHGARLTTMEWTFPRFILAEVNTHRVLSRNSASSRAIPVEKQIQKAREHPAMPVEFGSNQRGMQAGEEVEDPQGARMNWLQARDAAAMYAEALVRKGVHKQVANRLLEPFMWHTAIISATDWDGLWHQRCHPAAQPEFQAVATLAKEAYDASVPCLLGGNEYAWHTPLIQPDEDRDFWHDAFIPMNGKMVSDIPLGSHGPTELRKRVSVARCARVSYLTHDTGRKDIEADLALYDRLATRDAWREDGLPEDPFHASPLEHVATPCGCPIKVVYEAAEPYRVPLGHRGNFNGWDQMRHQVLGV